MNRHATDFLRAAIFHLAATPDVFTGEAIAILYRASEDSIHAALRGERYIITEALGLPDTFDASR